MKSDEHLRCSEVRRCPVVSAVPPHSLNPTAMGRLAGRPVVRSPEQLRLHRALVELDWAGTIGELNDASVTNQFVPEPILITTNGTILAGFGSWRSAVFDCSHEINCIEYPLNEEQAILFMLSHHRPWRGWNDFIRICVALKLEPYFQQRARDNMSAGGKYKGSANLPEAHRIDVREETARVVGVGARNVSNVKTILQFAHPRLIEALTDGSLSINRAVSWCKLPKAEQMEQFTNYLWERKTQKVIRQFVGRRKTDKSNLDFCAVIDALQEQEMRQPGSVVMRVGPLQSTVVLIGQDLLTGPHSQGRLKLT